MEWEIITNLVHISLNNYNDMMWRFEVCIYTDSTRTSIRGMPIGEMTQKGFITNLNDKEYIYKMIYAQERVGNGNFIMFFRRKRKNV